KLLVITPECSRLTPCPQQPASVWGEAPVPPAAAPDQTHSLSSHSSRFLSWSPDPLGCKLATAVTLEVEGGGPCEPDEKCEDRLEGQAQGQGN
ncbi:hypothetical protein DBR06_SOUSAS910028, partial [Sousa chinensis]